MEVHAHSHTERKKWTHYFWEFLMLFLAVFCGFLAENQREHYIEHQREMQFINSFINDLEADTARLEEIITNRTSREERLDSLAVLLNSDSALFFTKDIYFLAVTLPRITLFQFSPSDGTMLQLKNSGGLRLIRKRAATDSIVKYDAVIRSLLRLDEQEQEIINIQREIAPKIFNGNELSKFSDADNNPVRLDHSPPLTPGYKSSLNEFNYRLVSVKNVNKGYRREAKKLLKQATNLLSTLKKEYHLK
jgi:hypothetical protein